MNAKILEWEIFGWKLSYTFILALLKIFQNLPIVGYPRLKYSKVKGKKKYLYIHLVAYGFYTVRMLIKVLEGYILYNFCLRFFISWTFFEVEGKARTELNYFEYHLRSIWSPDSKCDPGELEYSGRRMGRICPIFKYSL